MIFTTQRNLIRVIAARWRNQYAPFTHDAPLFSERNGYRTGLTKKAISEKLDALDPETASVEDVANIIGNDSWTRLTCDQCGKDTDAVLNVGQEPDIESHTASLCKECFLSLAAMPWPDTDQTKETPQ